MSWADKAIEDMKASYEAELAVLRDRIEELVVERAVRLVNEDRYFFLKAEAAESKLAEARADALEENIRAMEAAKSRGRQMAGDQPGALVEAMAEVAAEGAKAYIAAIRALKSGGANG